MLGALIGLILAALASAIGGAPLAQQPTASIDAPWRGQGEPRGIEVVYETWRDAQRDRELPVKIYLPEVQGGERVPLVIFSHGLGGNREACTYLLTHWSSRGYACVTLQHPGSDSGAIRERRLGAARRATDGEQREARPLDVSFALTHALGHERLGAIVDPERIGVAGHSFGAFTAMAAVGATVEMRRGGAPRDFRDERIDCAIPLSPQGIGMIGQHEGSWDDIRVPVFFMTGTRDTGIGAEEWRTRLDGFRLSKGPDHYLLVLADGAHSAFTDATWRREPEQRPQHHGYIKTLSLEFLDAHLSGDDSARRWLAGDAPLDLLEDGSEFRTKNLTPPPRPGDAPSPE